MAHSSSESEIIALEASTRMEGLPALLLWEQVIEVFGPVRGDSHKPTPAPKPKVKETFEEMVQRILGDVDKVPETAILQSGLAKLVLLEDNEAVIKILAKGRSAKLRHVARTHRVNLDFLYDIFRYPDVTARYVKTNYQIADIGTKAINKGDTWQLLQGLMGIKFKHRNLLATKMLHNLTLLK